MSGLLGGFVAQVDIPWYANSYRRVKPNILANLRPEKALKLGLTADDSFEDNIRYFLEDDVQRVRGQHQVDHHHTEIDRSFHRMH